MRISVTLFLLLLSASLIAQQINYSILEDNPEKAYTKFLAPEFGTEYNSTTLSVFIGANGRLGISELITLEGAARFDLYNLNGSGPTFLLEGGGFLPFTTKIKTKEVPIILSYNPYAGEKYVNGQLHNIEETKYIKIPNGQYKNQIGIRGGIHNRRSGATNLTGTANTGIMLTGVYLGGQFTTQAYVKTIINDDAERIGAGFTRIFIDVLVLPVSIIGDPAADKDVKKDGLFGWRVGMQWYVSPHDGDYKFMSRSVFTSEIGTRPLSGFMFNLTWGFALLSSK